MDYIPDISEIITGEVEFYAHTVLRIGIADSVWYKVGKSLELGDYRDVFFRIDGDIDRVERSVKWYLNDGQRCFQIVSECCNLFSL